ncbi:MAG TPA: DNA translocase FtsK, partial [Gemmatirosa sp.]
LALKAAHAALGGTGGPSLGALGSLVAGALVALLGWSGAVLVPAAPLAHALRGFGRLAPSDDRRWLALLGGLAVLVPVAVALAVGAGRGEPSAAAGLWGGFAAFSARELLGTAGGWIVVLFAASALLVRTVAWNPVRALLTPRARSASTLSYADVLGEAVPAAAGRRGRKKALPLDLARALEPAPEEMPAADRAMLEAARDVGAPAVAGVGSAVASAVAEVESGRRGRKARGAAGAAEPVLDQIRSDVAAEAVGAEMLAERPPRELLDLAPPRNVDVNRRELDAAAMRLEEVLRTFRIDGQITGRTVGPTVTQFEYTPAAGVKVRQIASLADDLALAMRAPSIRIVAPIPGKGAVGIEVPNATREMVAFRDLVESREFQDAKAALPVALGKDLEGRTIVADLAKMPHLLIAGATGAGKSVCVNTIITSLVYRHTPRTLRFLMVDPKMVELSVYNDLPHMRHKVITDSKDAAAVLKWALMEMEERYALLAENGCRNLQDFNRRVRQHAEGQGAPLKAKIPSDTGFLYNEYTKGELPYVVVVIDEMADLMMTVQGEVETPIARLAQKARAIGIHLIIATQRPSVNVITGLIKANFPSRIAFRVASQIDSRTIIDGAGAELLLGNGDLLFIPPGSSEPSRIQGAYLSSEETERLMGWYRDRAEGTSAEARARAAGVDAELAAARDGEEDILEVVRRREALDAGTGSEDEPDAGERDKLFYEAAEVCIQHQGGSTSLLQRRLKIGYGRAARIIDQLNTAGVLGPPDGSKPRDVLIGIEELHRLPAGRD